MDKKLILAVAGSGKTYHLCNSIDPSKRNYILAYTNENIHNLQDELIKRFGRIPEKTSVSTFHSFLYSIFIRPNEAYVAIDYLLNTFRSKGVTIVDPEPQYINGRFNYKYKQENNIEHYYTKDKSFIYCSRMSKLTLKHDGVFIKGIERLNLFFDALYIDEFQDYRQNDYHLLEKIVKQFSGDILLVGDYFQHSVSGDNNSGVPFGTNKKSIPFDSYIASMKKLKLKVDLDSLKKSRRCTSEVCAFITNKLRIEIESCSENKGEIVVLNTIDEAIRVLQNKRVTKLVIKESKKYGEDFENWGNSKGNTYPVTCVILTDKLQKLCEDNFDLNGISQQTINKLYVALSRSKGDVYIMKKDLFDSLDLKQLS